MVPCVLTCTCICTVCTMYMYMYIVFNQSLFYMYMCTFCFRYSLSVVKSVYRRGPNWVWPLYPLHPSRSMPYEPGDPLTLPRVSIFIDILQMVIRPELHVQCLLYNVTCTCTLPVVFIISSKYTVGYSKLISLSGVVLLAREAGIFVPHNVTQECQSHLTVRNGNTFMYSTCTCIDNLPFNLCFPYLSTVVTWGIMCILHVHVQCTCS